MTQSSTKNDLAPLFALREGYEYNSGGPSIPYANIYMCHPDLTESQRRTIRAYDRFQDRSYARLITFLCLQIPLIILAMAGFYSSGVGQIVIFGCVGALMCTTLIVTGFEMKAKKKFIGPYRALEKEFAYEHPNLPMVVGTRVEVADRAVITLCRRLEKLFASEWEAETTELRKATYLASVKYQEQGAPAFDTIFEMYEKHTGKPVFTNYDGSDQPRSSAALFKANAEN